MKTKLLLLITIILSGIISKAATISVPGSFNTIQEAINASNNGDTVIVTPGIYYENINFRGKNIVVTSLYYLVADTSYITSTIINGSTPAFSDSASCVIFNSWEDSTAVLQGFTITGGAGTIWLDSHGAGVYREGGGILIDYASPTIKHNIITGNIVTNITGVASTGGGGIRVGDGDPDICNNVISFNQARYGAGIVLNYTGGKIRNNIIISNSGGQDYNGGSAIWINNNLPGTPKIIENNTIINNSASANNGTGGILVRTAMNVVLKNNIIYGNLPVIQIKTISSIPQVTYSNVEGGYAGAGNVDSNPMFVAGDYYLQNGSPCIDAGDQNGDYNDVEDINNPGNAQHPSSGTVINDIGAYGGPRASLMPVTNSAVGVFELKNEVSLLIYPNPASDYLMILSAELNGSIHIYDNTGKLTGIYSSERGKATEINTSGYPAGLYFVHLLTDTGLVKKSKVVINR